MKEKNYYSEPSNEMAKIIQCQIEDNMNRRIHTRCYKAAKRRLIRNILLVAISTVVLSVLSTISRGYFALDGAFFAPIAIAVLIMLINNACVNDNKTYRRRKSR